MMLSHTIPMRERDRRAAIVALVAISLLAPTTSYAEPTPAPTTDTQRSPLEQYRFDRDAYLEALKLRSQQIRFINIVFKESCDKASRDYKIAMSLARTPDQKNVAATVRKNAVSAAIVARDNAITALGAEPLPPVEPAKPLKATNKKKQR
jgi:membrane-bound lytic murein transglycosylase B